MLAVLFVTRRLPDHFAESPLARPDLVAPGRIPPSFEVFSLSAKAQKAPQPPGIEVLQVDCLLDGAPGLRLVPTVPIEAPQSSFFNLRERRTDSFGVE